LAPGRRSEIYRLAVGLAAAALFTATFSLLAGVAVDGWVIATLAAGGLLALRFPLHVSLSEKISVVTAVFFAAVLLLPVVQAAALVAAISGVDIAIAATRRVVANRFRSFSTPPSCISQPGRRASCFWPQALQPAAESTAGRTRLR